MNFTDDSAFTLLAAIVRKWIEDARKDPAELAAVADFLDMSPAQVLARKLQPLQGRLPELSGYRSGVFCRVCGREIRRVSEDPRGRPPKYCSHNCRRRANQHEQE